MAADPTIVKKLIINVTPTSAEFTGTITAPGLTSGQFTTVTFSNTDFVDGTYSTTVSLYTDFTVTIIDNSGKEYSATQNYDDSLIFNFTLTSSEITPATVSAKLTTIKTSLSNIKTSIVNKGVTPTGDITTYATAIDSISTSSGGEFEFNYTKNDVTNENPTINILLFMDALNPKVVSGRVKYNSLGGIESITCEQLMELKKEDICGFIQAVDVLGDNNEYYGGEPCDLDPAIGEITISTDICSSTQISASSEVYSRCIIFAIS